MRGDKTSTAATKEAQNTTSGRKKPIPDEESGLTIIRLILSEFQSPQAGVSVPWWAPFNN